MNPRDVTPLLLTRNEAANIGRTLGRLAWARRVVIVDSGSDDGTLDIARGFPNVEVFSRPFDRHGDQWNFGLRDTRIDTEWVLALDADYFLTEEFIEEIHRLEPPAEVSGYRAPFRYCVDGRPLRGTLYPPVTVLYRKARARYAQEGHTQRLVLDGPALEFRASIRHDDRKAFSRWWSNQRAYMRLEADHLARAPWKSLTPQNRTRRALAGAPAAFVYCLFVKSLWLDGIAGLNYSAQRALAEGLLSWELVRRYLGRKVS